MKVIIKTGLEDSKDTIQEEVHNDIIPRKDDIIYLHGKRYVVYQIILDYDYNEIGVWVKGCKK